MPGNITVETTQNVELELSLAPLGERVLACLIDGIIRGAAAIALLLLMGAVMPNLMLGDSWVMVAMLVLIALPFVVYHLVFEIFNHGQSPGKRLFGLRVVSLSGNSVSIGAYMLRWLFRLVDFQLFSGLVALIAVAASAKGQRVGDMVAGTTVIKEQRRIGFHRLAYDEPKPAYTPTYPQATQLSPSHIELIKETLNNFQLSASDTHIDLLAARTADILGVTYTDHPRKFLRTVVNDYSSASPTG